MINRPSSKIISAICASCIFFVLLFTGVMYLSKLGFVGNMNDPWLASLTSEVNEIVLTGTEITSVPVHIENLGTEPLEDRKSTRLNSSHNRR